MNDISTITLVRELDKRLADWNSDPEPQHDSFFELLSKGQCKSLEEKLHALLSKHARATIRRVIEGDPELLEQYKDQLKGF
jgi:hypothetical protein